MCGDGGGGSEWGLSPGSGKIMPTCSFILDLSGEITYLQCWRRGCECVAVVVVGGGSVGVGG